MWKEKRQSKECPVLTIIGVKPSFRPPTHSHWLLSLIETICFFFSVPSIFFFKTAVFDFCPRCFFLSLADRAQWDIDDSELKLDFVSDERREVLIWRDERKENYTNKKKKQRHRLVQQRVLWAVVLHKRIRSFFSNRFNIRRRTIHVWANRLRSFDRSFRRMFACQ